MNPDNYGMALDELKAQVKQKEWTSSYRYFLSGLFPEPEYAKGIKSSSSIPEMLSYVERYYPGWESRIDLYTHNEKITLASIIEGKPHKRLIDMFLEDTLKGDYIFRGMRRNNHKNKFLVIHNLPVNTGGRRILIPSMNPDFTNVSIQDYDTAVTELRKMTC